MKENENLKLSVVITAYNMHDFLKECVESVIAQTFPKTKLTTDDFEVIIVNDKSTDDTLDIIKSFTKGSKYIKFIDNKENVGPGLSRRFGIQASKGEYVLLLDGDDYLRETFLDDLYNRALETDADIVSGGITVLNEDGSYTATSYGNTTTEGYEKVTKFWGERIVFMNNKLIRHKLHDQIEYCSRRYIEDTPVIIPQLWLANKVEYVDNVGYIYRMNENSLTHKADQIKNVIYKGLCWLDLVDFFNKYDPKMFEYMPIKQYVNNVLSTINNMYITNEMIEPYYGEWINFTRRLFNIIYVDQIKFKVFEQSDKEPNKENASN